MESFSPYAHSLWGRHLNLASYFSVEILMVVGSQVWVNYHDHVIFPLSNATQTTISDESNWSYDNDINTEGDDDDDDDAEV